MIMLFLSLFAFADESDMKIVVEEKLYEEIYMEPVRVICEECTYEKDADYSLFVAANTHHHTYFRAGRIGTIYNQDTISLNYPECDFKTSPLVCANQNNLWLLKTTMTIDSERATLNLMLMNESGKVIGQSSYIRHKKTTIIPKTTSIQQIDPMGMRPSTEIEETEPLIREIPPIISENDIHQAMMILYDSVRRH